MFRKAILIALSATPIVFAHGKVSVVTGNAGGNGTALGIQGGIVPGTGDNDVTEVDTTVFGKKNIKTNGLGETTGQGENTVEMLEAAIAQSGDTLPQVSTTGGVLSGTFHIVTADGAGPLRAVVDTTGTGKFKKGTELSVITQVPGNDGNIQPDADVEEKRSLWTRGLEAVGLKKRSAANINKDFPMAFSFPDGLQCTGEISGIENVCLVKIANANDAGPFGGVVAIQMTDSTGTAIDAAGGTTATVTVTADSCTRTGTTKRFVA